MNLIILDGDCKNVILKKGYMNMPNIPQYYGCDEFFKTVVPVGAYTFIEHVLNRKLFLSMWNLSVYELVIADGNLIIILNKRKDLITLDDMYTFVPITEVADKKKLFFGGNISKYSVNNLISKLFELAGQT